MNDHRVRSMSPHWQMSFHKTKIYHLFQAMMIWKDQKRSTWSACWRIRTTCHGWNLDHHLDHYLTMNLSNVLELDMNEKKHNG